MTCCPDGRDDPSDRWWTDPPKKPTPILPGWRITWREPKTELLTSETVRSVVPVGKTWRITTIEGQVITPDRILAVARFKGGQPVEVWTTRAHGLDGMDGRPSTFSRPSYEDW